MFDRADSAFVAWQRQTTKPKVVSPIIGYVACPRLKGKTLIIADTMIATGSTIIESYKLLTKDDEPQQTFVAAVIASKEGIANLEKTLPRASIIVGAIDKELNKDFFIVPGLGDAGDLLYGAK